MYMHEPVSHALLYVPAFVLCCSALIKTRQTKDVFSPCRLPGDNSSPREGQQSTFSIYSYISFFFPPPSESVSAGTSSGGLLCWDHVFGCFETRGVSTAAMRARAAGVKCCRREGINYNTECFAGINHD